MDAEQIDTVTADTLAKHDLIEFFDDTDGEQKHFGVCEISTVEDDGEVITVTSVDGEWMMFDPADLVDLYTY